MEDDRTYNFFRFEDLRIYDKAISYVEWVYHLTTNLEESPNNRLIAKEFLKLSRSIATAIAEGSSRSKPQFVQLLKEAKTLVREALVTGTVMQRLKLISDEQSFENRELVIEMSRMLGALIASLEKPQRKQEIRDVYPDGLE